jgi:hypothetical protein
MQADLKAPGWCLQGDVLEALIEGSRGVLRVCLTPVLLDCAIAIAWLLRDLEGRWAVVLLTVREKLLRRFDL